MEFVEFHSNTRNFKRHQKPTLSNFSLPKIKTLDISMLNGRLNVAKMTLLLFTLIIIPSLQILEQLKMNLLGFLLD